MSHLITYLFPFVLLLSVKNIGSGIASVNFCKLTSWMFQEFELMLFLNIAHETIG